MNPAIVMALAVALGATAPAQAGSDPISEVVEAPSWSDVSGAVQNASKVLLITDLDNTVMEPAQEIGSDQWYRYLVRKALAEGESQDAAIDKALALWVRVQLNTNVAPTESGLPEILEALQARGPRTMGLTARPVNLAERTIQELNSVGVAFHIAPPAPGFSWPEAAYRDGVLFVGAKANKGEVLRHFLAASREAGYWPDRIIFVDDLMKNVTDMQAAVKDLGIDFYGFRYGMADAKVRGFDAEIADFELGCFDRYGRIVSDESARLGKCF